MISATAVRLEPTVVNGTVCRDWAESSELEWLETNGAGSFAMGTVSGANTRRYHSILTAALRPPVGRVVLLSRVEEEVLCDGEYVNLGAAQYPGAVTPAGFQMLESFALDPFPTWHYRLCCASITKSLFLVDGHQTAVLQYQVSHRCRLRVRPFLAARDYHSLQHESADFHKDVDTTRTCVTAQPFPHLPPLHLHHNAAGFVPFGHWYYYNEYRKEMDRGLDFSEDLYSPGWIDFELEAGETAYVVATTETLNEPPRVAALEAAERARRSNLIAAAPDAFRARLDTAAEQFLVRRADGSSTVIAGYPWFTDWGRDTMISLPGLLTSRGRRAEAIEILEGFLHHLHQGLIPNRFPDAAETPEYNTADGTLWLFPAVWDLPEAARNFLPFAREIIAWHERGTLFEICVDPQDGLLSAGGPGTQLTWMDAKVGDWVVTPRHGKPVEINALWYNALRMTAFWENKHGDSLAAAELTAKADRVLASFEAAFWNPARQCLYDRIAPEGPDDRLRPNQIFALSLPFPLMNGAQQRAILAAVEEHLLTPVGLRTLDPAHPEYRPRYEGSPLQRDGAYHQGTVWPWLLGPYVTARLHVLGTGRDNLAWCREILDRIERELDSSCLGTIAEIYDGDPPHRPTGAPAQAWSIAELIRISKLL